jgi:hypothetical protein
MRVNYGFNTGSTGYGTFASSACTRAQLVDIGMCNFGATLVVIVVTAFQRTWGTTHQIDPLLTVRAIT